MIICKTISEIRSTVRKARQARSKIAVVPTMGNLHAGHASLIDAAVADGNFTVVTIFVNPTQFGPNEDFSAYPRTPDQDLEICKSCGADAVFMPEVDEVYPVIAGGAETTVSVSLLGDRLCGASRPGHFDGVCTVVSKLFNIILPDIAYFGRKDAQQLAIIRQMVRNLDFPVEIRGCKIVRDADGLALSSRNIYLNDSQRAQALSLSQSLKLAEKKASDGCSDIAEILQTVRSHISANAPDGEIDYIEAVDPDTIQPAGSLDTAVLLALAVRFGSARLIDNAIIGG